MAFRLSSRSLSKLNNVHPDMTDIVHRAIQITRVDFGVTQGLRTLEMQKRLYAAGRSQTMPSKHLAQWDGYSHAVDVVAWYNGEICWELNLYDDICDAFKQAAIEKGVAVKWGAAWSEGDIRSYWGTAENAMNDYIDLRRSQGRRPFIDGPHYELIQ